MKTTLTKIILAAGIAAILAGCGSNSAEDPSTAVNPNAAPVPAGNAASGGSIPAGNVAR